MWNVMIDGHTIEFRDSSGIDPWTKEYCKEHNIPLQVTNNVETYVRLDNDCIYRMDTSNSLTKFQTLYEKGTIKDFHDILSFLFDCGMLEKRMCHISPLYNSQ